MTLNECTADTHKTTEQKPKSAFGLAELINFFLETYFPRITPSTSIPGWRNNDAELQGNCRHCTNSDWLTPDLDFVVILQ